MLSDPRSISFILECIHQPVQHDAKQLKRFYAKTVENELLGYSSFNAGPAAAQMTTIHGPASFPNTSSHSVLTIGQDRIQIKEEWPRIGFEDFVDKSQAAIALAAEHLSINGFMAIQCVVRSLVSVQGVEDCRDLLNDRFINVDDADKSLFGRPPALYGVRMAFPAAENDPCLHNVRVESFGGDIRSIFIEDAGVLTQNIAATDWAAIESPIRSVYDFLNGPVITWLTDDAD